MNELFEKKRRLRLVTDRASKARAMKEVVYEKQAKKIEDLLDDVVEPLARRAAMRKQIVKLKNLFFYDRPSQSVIDFLESLTIVPPPVLEVALMDFITNLPELRRKKKGKALYNTWRAYLRNAKPAKEERKVTREDLGL